MSHHSVRIDLYRHSYAEYGPFKPDLTPEGVELARERALEIAAEIDPDRRQYLRIISSPKPRALGTADCICRALNIPISKIQQETDLSDYLVHDLEERNRILMETSPDRDFHRGWDAPYYNGDLLHDAHPEIFETRMSVAHRAFRWLGKQFQDYHDGRLHADTIVVSHAEVLNLMLAPFRLKNDPIRQCERLRLELTPSAHVGGIHLRAIFRDKVKEGVYDTPATAFSRQLGEWL